MVTARAQTDPTKRVLARERERMAARAAWQNYFRSHDAFLTPACFTAAFPHDARPFPERTISTPEGARPYMDLTWWIATAPLTGCPATVVPAGRTGGGLPVGLQILGPYLEDATPIDLAVKLADVLGGFQPPPGY